MSEREPRAVDTHVHIFDPARFPYRPGVVYRPLPHETAPVESLIAVLDAHGVSHAVVVTPMAGYQSDNGAMLDALACCPDRLRGMAVVEGDVTEEELVALRRQGVAGVRVDLIGRGTDYLRKEGRRLPGLLAELDLILQVQCEGEQLAIIAPLLRQRAGPVLIDHMGRPDLSGDRADALGPLLALADRARTYVKLSGPFRFARGPWPYADADPIARAILARFGPERCVWGSDWPFVRMDHRLDYGPTLALLVRWLPDPAARAAVLWHTPARLFGLEGGR